MKFKTRYTRSRVAINPNMHPDTGEVFQSLTRQEHKDECDINSILQRYETTGDLPPGRPSAYLHCTAMDYQESFAIIHQANEAFAELPARLRDQYGNSPQRFLEAFDRRDPELAEAAVKYGLIPDKTPTSMDLLFKIATNTSPQKPADKPGAGTPT